MATRFAARSMEEHQRSRESAGGNAEARHKATLAPLQGGGIGSRRESGAVTRLQLYNQIAVKTGPNSHVSIGSVRLADQNVTALIGIQATDDVGVAADAVAEIVSQHLLGSGHGGVERSPRPEFELRLGERSQREDAQYETWRGRKTDPASG